LCCAETWTLREVDQKYLASFEMWCWRQMDISRTDRVRNVIKRRKVNWTGHILRRNALLKHIIGGKIEGKVEVTGR